MGKLHRLVFLKLGALPCGVDTARPGMERCEQQSAAELGECEHGAVAMRLRYNAVRCGMERCDEAQHGRALGMAWS
eukprot:9380865-Alexandrium_andersonii.AAC.1